MLTIKIEAIDFDTLGCVLRVRGRNIRENQYVKVKLETLDVLKPFLFPLHVNFHGPFH